MYTSVIIGIIPLLFFISKINDKNLKKKIQQLIILPAFFSFIFYPLGNNPLFNKINFNDYDNKLLDNRFIYHRLPIKKVSSINFITDLVNNCNVDYLENLTFDSFFSTIGNLKRLKIIPYQSTAIVNLGKEKFHIKDILNKYFIINIDKQDIKLIDLINHEIENENIIVLYNQNKNIYNNDKIDFNEKYKNFEINESNDIGKPQLLNVYFPLKCFN